MGRMKDLWVRVHDDLMEEYGAAHPELTDEQVSEATWMHVEGRIADMGDAAYDRWKDQQHEA